MCEEVLEIMTIHRTIVIIAILSLGLVGSVTAKKLFCFIDEEGYRYFSALPDMQPSAGSNAAEHLANGFQGLANMIPKPIAFVEDSAGQRIERADFVEMKGGKSTDRLIIQFRPAMGNFCGILPVGTKQMSSSWLVQPHPSADIDTSASSGNDYPVIRYRVVVLPDHMGKREKQISTVNNVWPFEKEWFDERGRLLPDKFEEIKSDLRIVEVVSNHIIPSFHRFAGGDLEGRWPNDELMYMYPFRSAGTVFSSFSPEDFLSDIYAITLDCLTEEQEKYVASNWFGRFGHSAGLKFMEIKQHIGKFKFEDLPFMGMNEP